MTPLIQKTVTLPCHPKSLNEARALLKDALGPVDFPKRDKDLIVLAVDEVVSSIVRYASFKGWRHEITLTIDIDDVRFKALVSDSLNAFDVHRGMTEAQLAEKLAGDKSHTMGLFLVRQIMDEISYVYRKGFQNEIELIKFL